MRASEEGSRVWTIRRPRRIREALQRFWLDETATASGRSVKVATAVVALLAAGGLVAGLP